MTARADSVLHAVVVDLDVSMIKVEEPGRAIVPARRNRPCRPGFAAAWRARCARCGGAVRPQRGGRGAGAAGWLLRVQSEFMRPAFDAVKEVDDFEQPGTERTAGLGPFKELSSHRCAPWGRVAVPTWTGCAGGRFLFRSEILRICTSVRLCSQAGQGGLESR